MKIIGVILNKLLEEYNKGTCDNLDDATKHSVMSELNNLYEIITSKQDKTLTTEQASIYLNVSRQSLHNYIKEGKLHPKKQLGGVLQYSEIELKKLKNNGLQR